MAAAFHIRGFYYLLCFVLLHLVSSRIFFRKTEFDGYMCHTEDIIFERTVPSAVKCAESCLRLKACLDIYYMAQTKLCVGCKVWYATYEISRTIPGSKCYEKRKGKD